MAAAATSRPDWTSTDTDGDMDGRDGTRHEMPLPTTAVRASPPTSPVSPLRGSSPENSCMTRGLKIAEHAFGLLTVLINLADVATDIYIAIQFHQEGETTWFWLVVSSLIVAHLVYTILGTDTLPRNDEYWRWRDVRWPIRFVLSFIFAQFIPVINLLATACGYVDSDSEDAANPYGDAFEHQRQPGSASVNHHQDVSLAALEELEGARKAQVLQERMAQAAKSHLFRYGLFYVESGIESAPQAIIQLLAITFLGRASPAQLVSLCCSLFSIASKACIISQAYQIRVMVLQFSLAAFDVFSTFYLFSTLVAQETEAQTTFFGLEVSWLTCVWLWKMVVFASLGFIGGLALAVRRCVTRRGVGINGMDECKKRTVGFLILGLALIASGPLLLVAEAAKLSWITFVLHQTAPDRSDWSMHALLLSFLEKDDGERSRLRHVCRFIGQRYVDGSRTPDPRTHSAEAVKSLVAHHDAEQQRRLAAYGIAPRPYTLPGGFAALADLADDPDANNLSEWAVRDCCHCRFRVDEATGRMRLCPGTPFGVHFREYLCSEVPWSAEKREQVILETLSLIAVGIYALGQLFSLAYVVGHASQSAETHNILQLTCLIATGVTFLFALVLAPAGYVYARHNLAFDWCSSFLTRLDAGGATPAVLTMVTEYHTPPFVECLQAAVPPCVLPVEVTGLCAGFLGPRDVRGLHRLTIEQSAALKQEIADRAIVAVELAPEDRQFGSGDPAGPVQEEGNEDPWEDDKDSEE